MKLRNFIRFLYLPSIEKGLLIAGVFYSFIVFVAVKYFPLKSYLFLLNNNKLFIKQKNTYNILFLIRSTINRLDKITPWDNTCLVKAITMKLLLNHYGIKSQVILSLSKINLDSVSAHAFIRLEDNTEVFKIPDFREVYAFGY